MNQEKRIITLHPALLSHTVGVRKPRTPRVKKAIPLSTPRSLQLRASRLRDHEEVPPLPPMTYTHALAELHSLTDNNNNNNKQPSPHLQKLREHMKQEVPPVPPATPATPVPVVPATPVPVVPATPVPVVPATPVPVVPATPVPPVPVPVDPSIVGYRRTTTRKKRRVYPVGKKDGSNQVSVFIKDQSMRHKVVQAQSELRSVSMHDVKTYLTRKKLIPIGSHAPNALLRCIHEYAVQSGEVCVTTANANKKENPYEGDTSFSTWT